jgi:DNA-directed RNA polymerase omega subunit
MSDPGVEQVPSASGPIERAPRIESRFLFVDVAAMRAKQLRRGAIPRVATNDARKFERVAMDEVDRGLISYELPEAASRPEAA